MAGGVGFGAGQEDAVAGLAGQRRPDLLAVHHPLVAVAHGPGRQRGQVAARLRFGEQLAPDLRPVQQPGKQPALLFLGAGQQQGRPGPADADGVLGPVDPARRSSSSMTSCSAGDGSEPPRRGPVRGGVPGRRRGGRTSRGGGRPSGSRVSARNCPDPRPGRFRLRGQVEVHDGPKLPGADLGLRTCRGTAARWRRPERSAISSCGRPPSASWCRRRPGRSWRLGVDDVFQGDDVGLDQFGHGSLASAGLSGGDEGAEVGRCRATRSAIALSALALSLAARPVV